MSKPEKKKPEKKGEAPPVDGEADGEAKPKKKGLPIMLIAIIGGAVLVLGGGGAAAYFLLLAPKHPPAAEAGKDAHAEKKPEKKKEKKEGEAPKVDPKTIPAVSDGPEGTVYFAMPDTIANIESAQGAKSYVKAKLTFECPDHDTADLLMENLPRINDILQGFLAELRPEDLAGSAGKIQLRLEILRRINLVIAPSKINSVLIEQLLIT